MSSISFAVKLAKASIPDDLRNDILKGNYPHVARTADPLLVRPDALSLMVSDTVYHARVKLGLGCKGYYIYASGLGTAVYENVYTSDREFNIEFGTNDSTPDSDAIKAIKEKAKEWLDELEVAIASHPSDNSVKKAIDRLCWQMHYDITESHLNFPEAFSDNDFADVQIDRYGATNWDGTTLKTSIADNYTNISNSVSGGATTICGGSSLQSLSNAMSSAISTFDTNLNGTGETSTKNTIKSALNTIGTKLVPDGNYYSISECLRDHADDNTYSIARSLREGSEDSVSQATYDQTQLEDRRFTSLDNNIGDFSIGTDPDDNPIFVSLAQRIGEPLGENGVSRISEASKDTLFDAIYRHPGRVRQDVNGFNGGFSSGNESVSSNIKTYIVDKLGDTTTSGTLWYDVAQTKTAVGTPSDAAGAPSLFGRIGTSSRTLTDGVTPSTILAETDAMYTAMFGRSGSYGFVGGPTDGPDSTFYTKSRTSDKDYRWIDY